MSKLFSSVFDPALSARLFNNIIVATDSYKASHWVQLPDGVRFMQSYIEARGGKFDMNVFLGIQMFCKRYLTARVTQQMVDDAATIFALHGEPFNRAGWEYIVNELDGKLPLRIRSVPEGTVIPYKNALVVVENTDPNCAWLVSYVETPLLRSIWYPTTVATVSFQAKLAIMRALEASCDNPEREIAYRLHDFGARGNSSQESAGIAGLAHLVNFMGTDTVEGLLAAMVFYGEEMAGHSIPAAEHSTITSWGRNGEVAAYRNMLKHFAKPGALLAVVSDSYDLFDAVENIWGDVLRTEVEDSGATLVVRPDSGDPLTIPVQVIEKLGERFGYTVNKKGFKVLATRPDGTPVVRVIQGDGITVESLPVIYANLLAAGWSAENLTCGMGGGLHQQVNRDLLKFAMKCCAVSENGVWKDVYKAPKTDPGKRSKRGRLALVQRGEIEFETVPFVGNEETDALKVVYEDGVLLINEGLGIVRGRAASGANAILAREGLARFAA